ncbi:hypothetical protein FAM09_25525 [Niastella caeni]|uniref:Uncharacterized protein n=1 Tax=Niastella caeni TaxID=2569763 RepID=A0A4S8HGA3_9BACT|nr:hypothetical protein [Niastella caeni]THU33511.1 hypothetical protein FAM09_25525 [Niastella caeni]
MEFHIPLYLTILTTPLYEKTPAHYGLLATLIYACNQSGKTFNSLLNTGKLPTQLFSIDITKDTTLVTKNGGPATQRHYL